MTKEGEGGDRTSMIRCGKVIPMCENETPEHRCIGHWGPQEPRKKTAGVEERENQWNFNLTEG